MLSEVLVNTGQHFDANMSDVFFKQLGLPKPNYQLGISGGTHGEMLGRMLVEIEQVIIREEPDTVVVYGDTNSTLAGALAAVKLHIPVTHIESGLRSFNMRMPEEVNRILTDQISDILFCPTEIAMQNLRNEGFERKPVEMIAVGDVMQDSALFFAKFSNEPRDLPTKKSFVLATFHRAENTDDVDRLRSIVTAINHIHEKRAPVVVPLHPRTRAAIQKFNLELIAHVIEPVGYLEMIWLLENSGGVQKESYFFGKYCVTLRDETEWVELVEIGANRLAGTDRDAIVEAVNDNFGKQIECTRELYGGGNAAEKIVAHLSAIAGQASTA
jgi:UDP-GlcNAc3NAcA epimerase